jgi:hypothetical protein
MQGRFTAPDRRMTKEGAFARFSLLGGPFHDLASRAFARFGIGRSGGGGFALGLGFVLWLVLALLAVTEGSQASVFSLETAGIHVRLLVALPLVLVCLELFDRAVRDACHALIKGGIIAAGAVEDLDRTAYRLVRLSKSWWLQLGLMATVVIAGLVTPPVYLPGLSSNAAELTILSGSLAGQWYWYVCLPIFRFVIIRFWFLLVLWTYQIWRISRQPLQLTASHPDGAGGLGLIEVAQAQLVVFVLAMASLDAAALVEMSQTAGQTESQILLHVLLVAIAGVVIILGPLLFLVGPLYRARRDALVAFGDLAQEYARRFQVRWIGPGQPDYRELLGSSDIQSLADLGNSFQTVQHMRVLLVSKTLLMVTMACAALPHLVLPLLKYPITVLVSDLARIVIGG